MSKLNTEEIITPKPTKKRMPSPELSLAFSPENKYEIGVDEAGRGPLFGRLYVAAVVLPKDDTFLNKGIKDSKKITSKKKLRELAEYIKKNSIAWHIHYIESNEIDEINIRQAVLKAMRICIQTIIQKIKGGGGERGGGGESGVGDSVSSPTKSSDFFLLIDGNDFPPYLEFDSISGEMYAVPHETIPGGDNLYLAIASASILAKTARDDYILELCEKYPLLGERYGLDKNMGYGTKLHLEGIEKYGITDGHRKTYGRCKDKEVVMDCFF